MKIQFTFEKATKRTYRFAEVGDPDDHKVGTIYVKQAAFDGQPEGLTVEITPTNERSS